MILLCGTILNAQVDDIPYLTDEDIAAIEEVLPDDVPEVIQEKAAGTVVENDREKNEIGRLNASQKIFHLLILDRRLCSLNADIGGINSREVLYKYRHGTNGYLVAVYTSPREGPVFPQFPDRSRIIVNMTTARVNTLIEYINSDAFRRFVTNRTITAGLLGVLEVFK